MNMNHQRCQRKPKAPKKEMQGPSHLDKDLLLELVWRWQPICGNIHWLGQQHVSKHLLKGAGHVPLLDDAAVVLNGQNDRKAVEKKGFISLVFLPHGFLLILKRTGRTAFA